MGGGLPFSLSGDGDGGGGHGCQSGVMQGSWAWAGRGQPAVTYRCLLKGTRTPPYILGSSLRTRCMMSHVTFTHYTASHDHGVKLLHFGSVSQVNTDVCRSTIRLLYSVLLPQKHPSPPPPQPFPSPLLLLAPPAQGQSPTCWGLSLP